MVQVKASGFSTSSTIQGSYDTIRASQGALVVKNTSANTGDLRDVSLIPGLGRYPGERNGQKNIWYYCLLKLGNKDTVGHGWVLLKPKKTGKRVR